MVNSRWSNPHVIGGNGIFDKGHRYRLDRKLDCGEGTLAVFMVNPSKANAVDDDHTIAKVEGFAVKLGYRYITVGNIFSYIATDIDDLRDYAGPETQRNFKHVERMMKKADLCIVAWGSTKKLPLVLRARYRYLVAIAERIGCPLHCFGTCADGHPVHPLRIAYASRVRRWKPPRSHFVP